MGLREETIDKDVVVGRREERAETREPSLTGYAWRRLIKNRMAVTGGITVILLIMIAVFAPFIAPQHYTKGSFKDNYAKPGNKYLLGADFMGRDILSRIIFGSRVSLSVAFVGAIVSFVIGVSYGVISGYWGGKTDNAMMRFVDIMFGFPDILFVIILMVFFRSTFADTRPGTLAGMLNAIDNSLGGMFFIFIGIGVTSWLNMARLARGEALSLREKEFVEGAKAIGGSNSRIIFRHLLPNLVGPCIVAGTLSITRFILFEAFLSFIGLGVNPPTPSWGMMIAEGFRGMRSYPHLVLYPVLAIVLTMFAFNFLGDGLRDAFDPRLKGSSDD